MKKVLLFLLLFIGLSTIQAQVSTITSFTPNTGVAGTLLTISGTDFNTTPTLNVVYVGGVVAPVISVSSTTIKVKVPKGVSGKPISVTNLSTGLTAYSAKPFLITFTGGTNFSSSSMEFAGSNWTTQANTAGVEIEVGDIDADGKMDLSMLNTQYTNDYTPVTIVKNTTDGDVFWFTEKSLTSVALSPQDHTLADVNGDGKLDILLVSKAFDAQVNEVGKFWIYRNNSASDAISFEKNAESRSPYNYTIPSQPTGIAVGDLDEDGKPDAVMCGDYGNQAVGNISVYRNLSTLSNISFSLAKSINTSVEPMNIKLEDFDGDGKLDMVALCKFGNATTGELVFYRNISTAGTINFAAGVAKATVANSLAMATGDVDSDGKPDLVVAGDYNATTSGKVSILRNTSTGGTISFAASVDYNVAVQPREVVIGDLEGNYKPEIVVAGDYNNTTNGKISVLRNVSASGTITMAGAVNYLSLPKPIGLAISDMNEDGKADIAVGFENSKFDFLRNVNTVKASNFEVLGYTNNSINIGWTRGSGDGVIVVAREASAIDANPTRGASYTGNAAYSIGTQVGTGNYTVYKGTGTSVNVTGLKANTIYYFNVYEYKSTSDYETAPLQGNVTTQNCTPAATQASNMTFSNITTSSMIVNWVRGSGAGVVVLAREGESVNASPVDGQTYTFNTVFGNQPEIGTGNFVVYSGTGTWANVTGLKDGVDYHYAVYERSASNCYRHLPLEGNISTTCSYSTTQVSNLSFTNITDISMTLNWVKGSGASVLVVAREGAAVTMGPVDGEQFSASAVYGVGSEIGNGNYVIYNGNGNSVTMTGLKKGCTYYFTLYDVSDTYCYKRPTLAGNALTTGNPWPSILATNFKFASVTTHAATLSWTRGNGAAEIIVAREFNVAEVAPVDGQVYSASNYVGHGDQTGPGNYVVFNSDYYNTGISGLKEGTQYVFTLYERSSLNSYSPVGISCSFETPKNISYPTIQASNFVVTAKTDTTMTIGWTRGNGAVVMVVARMGFDINTSPTDLTYYDADARYGAGDYLGGGYVVYKGTGTSVKVTNLRKGQTVYYSIHELTQSALYLVPDLYAKAKTSGCTPPASNYIPISSVLSYPTSLMADWDNVDQYNILAVVRETGSTVKAKPTDGKEYYYNSTFGKGDEIGVGNYVVENGRMSWAIVNNLKTNTQYSIALYLYDSSNYCYSDIPNYAGVITKAACEEPTVQASGLTGSNITDNSMKLSWTNGNGDHTVVVASAGGPVDYVPVDGLGAQAYGFYDYSNTSVGDNNQVVYNGVGNTFDFTGLKSGITYHFAVYTASSTACYKKTPLIGSFTTLGNCNTPTLPTTNFKVVSLQSNSTTLGWTRGNGASIMVVAKLGAPVDAMPKDGTKYHWSSFGGGSELGVGNFVVYDAVNSNSSSGQIFGLKNGLEYHFALYEYSSNYCYLQLPLRGSYVGGTPTSINELAENSLTIYPNPFQNQLHVNLIDAESRVVYQLINTSGDIVKSGELNGSGDIETSELASGLYILRLFTQEGVVWNKVLKQ